MLVSRLFRSLLSFLLMGIVPDGGGGAPDAAPPADAAPDAAQVTANTDAAAAPDTSAPLGDPMAGLRSAIDAIGAPASTQPRDPQGRFAPIDPNAAPAPVVPPVAPAPAAQTPAAPVPPVPKPGEFDLTPPEGMTERAQARWAQLTERAKQLPEFERRATEATTALDNVRKMVSDAGLAPEEFTNMLQIGRMVKSSSPQDMQQALAQLDTIRADIAMRLGVDVPGVDPLAAHADLRQKVDGLLLSREDALEIARYRQQSQQWQQTEKSQRELQDHQQLVQRASTEMDSALQALAGTPGHQEKLNYIGQHFRTGDNLQKFVQTYPPALWQPTLMAMYHAYTPQPAPVPPPPAPAAPQPLRSSGMRQGAPLASGPVTAESAIANAFASIGQ